MFKQLSTIKSRLTIFAGIMVILYSTALTIIYTQTEGIKSASESISKYRIKALAIAGQIESGILLSANHLRAYVITKDKLFNEKRANVWIEKITPNLKELKRIKSETGDDKLEATLDSLTYYLSRLRDAQVVIEGLVTKNGGMQEALNPAALSSEQSARLAANHNANQLINEKFKEIILPNFNALMLITQRLSENQNDLLNKELVSTNDKMDFLKDANLLIALLGIAFIIASIMWLYKSINYPLVRLKDFANNITNGKIDFDKVEVSDNEMGELTKSIVQLASSMQNTSQFAKEIGDGNLQVEYTLTNSEDELGNSLVLMRDNLLKNKIEEDRRAWTATGLAELGELLRSDYTDENTMYNRLISFAVKYTGSNQGGLFLLNEENRNDKYLELAAAYAYEKKKYLTKRVELNEGLLGQAYMEADIVYMTDVPQNYVHITSGLGEATPGCIILVPLKVNEDVNGVLELATFTPYETYKIEFIKRMAESVASTITSVKINIRTKLLLEQSQQQTEEMKAQEEEMRQNMEEMQTTQEEMERLLKESAKNQAELKARMAQVDEACIVSETDLKGIITYVNDKFCQVAKYTREELIGKPHNIVRHPDMPAEAFKQMWATIGSGKIFRAEVKNRAKDGSPYWVDAIIAPVLGENGKPVKYIGIRYDITDQKKMQMALEEQMKEMQLKEEELSQHIEEMNATNEEMQRVLAESNKKQAELNTRIGLINEACIVSESDLKGNITYVNDKFCEVSKYTKDELIGMPHSIVRHPDMPKEVFRQMWATIGAGKIFRGEVKNKAKDGTPYWVDAIIAPVLGQNGKPVKYIGVRYDITESKKMHAALEEQMKQMLLKEEELRQHVEEMRAIQEDLERKNEELNKKK